MIRVVNEFKKKINNLCLDDAVGKIAKDGYGVHDMIIYPNQIAFRKFYSFYTIKQIEEKNEFIQIMPFYETTDSVRQTLFEKSHIIDNSKDETDNSFATMDSLKYYFGNSKNIDVEQPLEDMVECAKKLGKKGLSVIGDLGIFSYKGKIPELVDYELSLSKYYDRDIKCLCFYHQQDFNNLTNEQKQSLFEHHDEVINIKI